MFTKDIRSVRSGRGVHSDDANGLVAAGLARNGLVGLSVGGAGSASLLLIFSPAFTNPLSDCSTDPYDESFFFSIHT